MQFHIGNSMLEMLQILNRNLVSVFQNTEKAVGWENILATTITRGIRETHRERFYSTVCYCLHCWWNMECRPCWHAAIQENGIKIIFEEGRQSEYLWVDKGKDFYSKHLKDLSDKYSIIMYSTENEEKPIVLERWNRTIKQRITLCTYRRLQFSSVP